MTELVLIAPRGSIPTLTMLAQRLEGVPGFRVVEDHRLRQRRVKRVMWEHGRRTGQDRRVPPMLKGAFALVERA